MVQHLRYAFRMLRKRPGSTLIAVLAMGLGIALTAAMFAILDGVFLRGLPFPESDRLVHLERNDLARDITSMEVTQHDFEDWQAQQTSFEGLAGWTWGTINVAGEGVPERFEGAWISTNTLDVLRVRPVLGRGFVPEDGEDGAAGVLLIGHHVWQKRYGGDPDVIGLPVLANSEPATIVGVMPEGFRFPVEQDVWMPLQLETGTLQRGEGTTLEVIGRLRDGVERDRAANEMATIAARLAEQYPDTNEGVSTVVQSFMTEFIGDETIGLLKVMFVAVVLVLLIACFNVANLLIGRAVTRSRELAIRSALGSGRWHALGQVLTEAALLAFGGAVLGLALAHFALRLFVRVIARMDTPFWFHFAIDSRVLLVTLLATVTAALIAGLVPALQASRPDVGQVLQDTGRGSTSFKLGKVSRALVVLEVALSCALLVGAGLTVRSVLSANHHDLRFDTENLLSARMGLFEGDHPEESDWVSFYQRLRERVAAHPEVVSAAVGTTLPLDTEIGGGGTLFERPGETYDHPRQMPWARQSMVAPGYFETLGVPLLAGRDFSLGDREGTAKVAIVNQDFANREWPGESAIGQRVDLWLGEEDEAAEAGAGEVEVIGVVPTLRVSEFDNEDDQHGIYLPIAQRPVQFAWIIARTRGEPTAFVEPLRRTVLGLDANLPLYYVRSMDQVIEETLFYSRLTGGLFTIFGAVAALLASIGLYGVMAFAVSQRTQEMGVRQAFGARGLDVVKLILGQGLRQVSIGLVLGLLMGAGLGTALSTVLFEVGSIDPVTFVVIPIMLILVATVACLVPARRASTVSPIEALRYE